MGILELCDSDVAAVGVEVSAAAAIRLMLDRHVGAVGVVDSEGLVAGIFTERDVLRKLSLTGRDPSTTPVRELMTTRWNWRPCRRGRARRWPSCWNAIFATCRWWTIPASCWACFPFATCWNSGSVISARNWTRSSNTSPTMDPAASGAGDDFSTALWENVARCP